MIPLIPVAMSLAHFAPQLIGLLGGKKAEQIAAQVVGIAQTVTGTESPDAALDAIRRSPDTALEFQRVIANKEIELARIDADVMHAQFGVTLAQIDAEVKQSGQDVDDRKDARGMQVATRSAAPAILAVVITVGFFVVVGLMLSGVFKPSDNQSLLILLGALSAGFGQVLNFYFGSSHGSQQKSEQMARMVAK